jgi:hypothetical protein
VKSKKSKLFHENINYMWIFTNYKDYKLLELQDEITLDFSKSFQENGVKKFETISLSSVLDGKKVLTDVSYYFRDNNNEELFKNLSNVYFNVKGRQIDTSYSEVEKLLGL